MSSCCVQYNQRALRRGQTQVVILGLLEIDLQDLFYLPRRFYISIRSSIWTMTEKYTPKVLVIMVGLFL